MQAQWQRNRQGTARAVSLLAGTAMTQAAAACQQRSKVLRCYHTTVVRTYTFEGGDFLLDPGGVVALEVLELFVKV
jgi:hypothetical protein